MLQLKQISKTFLKGTPNEHRALRQVDLTLQDGDFVTVVGSNGAGKSTLFNVICGNFYPDAGSVLLDGKDITWMPEHKRPPLSAGYFRTPCAARRPI